MVDTSKAGDAGTPARILDAAEHLVQARGFNGFSYADVAAELRLTKPALHYHFASKAALGEALITRYTSRFVEALASIDRKAGSAPAKLARYADLYLAVLNNQRMCLCGMLAAEYQTLPTSIQASVIHFFDQNETWLAEVLADGRREGSLHFAGSPRDTARVLIAGLEGAMLVARSYGDVKRFKTTAHNLLASLASSGTAG